MKTAGKNVCVFVSACLCVRASYVAYVQIAFLYVYIHACVHICWPHTWVNYAWVTKISSALFHPWHSLCFALLLRTGLASASPKGATVTAPCSCTHPTSVMQSTKDDGESTWFQWSLWNDHLLASCTSGCLSLSLLCFCLWCWKCFVSNGRCPALLSVQHTLSWRIREYILGGGPAVGVMTKAGDLRGGCSELCKAGESVQLNSTHLS